MKRMARGVLGIIVALIGQVACYALAYVVTSWIYTYWNIQLPDLTIQLINVCLGSLFAFGIIMFIGFFSRPRQMHIFNAILDAMQQISKGNFNISLEKKRGNKGHFDHFVDGINHMAQQLKHLETMRQEFISNVSHEIQSPLTSINGFAQAMQNEKLSEEERQHYLHIIETESKRLSKLSDNLLKLTSLESEHHPFEPKPYRLDVQLRNIILACEPLWLNKSIEMDISLIRANVTADEELMSQVWINLIHNSIKFTPEGGTVSVSMEQLDNQAVVCISDTGIGVAEEDQTRIFERFFKADKSRNRASSGSGLGLSIVKNIVERHNGMIRVESKLGEGTSITVVVPGIKSVS
ncbi:two-component sensor histidine kinase [Paenibacillus sp. LMG 31456]|uniref:histidine kinase n=1 Tax=Paenibacillus foliorum TaxID=2654974 RepID=A0A972K208_9BACL|nr:HAMP domain-containing sensor histidine kinase [Paenibacillus foliorum]NOU96276.1 two-component sensor histidine kinase [Paenibacillus foliorum]